MKGFRNGLGLAVVAISLFSAGAASGSVAVDCRARAAEAAGQFRVNTPYERNARILDLDPERLCAANRGAPGNQKQQGNHVRDQQVCETAYLRAKEAVQQYQQLAEVSCQKSLGIDLTNATGGGLLTGEVVRRAREAADAELAAARKLEEAKTQVAEFGNEAARLRDRYKSDLDKINAAEQNYREDRAKIESEITDPAERARRLQELDNTRNTSDRIVNNRYAAPEGGTGLLSMIAGPDVVAARRGKASTITGDQGYMNLIASNNRRIGLLSEQQLAYETSKAFETRAQQEIDRRTALAQQFQNYATRLEPIARRETESVVRDPVTGNNTITGGSTLGQMQQAMQLTQATAGLSNAVNGNQNAGATQAAAPSMWENVTGAVQNITGLGGGNGPGSSKLGGDNVAKGGGTQPAPGDLPGTPKGEGPGRTDLSGSFGVASNGDTFVTGLGDLPESGAASRTPAAARAKPGEGFGADVKGTKKRKGDPGAEKAACPPDQDCSALAATGSAFNKGGSLGVPLVGAADPGLNVKGALDGLFGELPTLDANGHPAAPLAAADAGFGLAESELGVGTGQAAGGQQGSPEVAPANSRTLFARVRGAHEKALKKGAVSLFHKKL